MSPRISFDDDATASHEAVLNPDVAIACPSACDRTDLNTGSTADQTLNLNTDTNDATATVNANPYMDQYMDQYTDAPLPTRAIDPTLFSDELSPVDSAVDVAADDAIAPNRGVDRAPDHISETDDSDDSPSPQTIALAVRDVRLVLQEQREQGQILTTKLNILFVTNGALLTSLSISRLMMIPSPFTVAEMIGFFISFTLLVRAFLPRQVAVSPNLEDRKFLERYLVLSPLDYQLQMLVNWSETYNANKQRLDDVSKTLRFAAYATLTVATTMLIHILAVYVL